MVLATLIAAVGIMTDSQILIIGAMVVGPEFGPLAGFAVAVVQRRLDLARRSFIALAVGFPVAIAASFLLTVLLRALGPAPDELSAIGHPATLFISDPNTFSVIVALLAGITGVLSLTTAKSGALIGVLISVTTIPAAANVGVAAAVRRLGRVPRRARPARDQPPLPDGRGSGDALGAALRCSSGGASATAGPDPAPRAPSAGRRCGFGDAFVSVVARRGGSRATTRARARNAPSNG